MKKWDDIDRLILQSIPCYQWELNSKKWVSKGRLSRRIMRLEAENVIKRTKQGNSIKLEKTAITDGVVATLVATSQGGVATSNYLPSNQPVKIPKRLHALGLKYRLRNPLSKDQPVYLLQQIKTFSNELPLNNTSIAYGKEAGKEYTITMELTTNNLILYAPELYGKEGIDTPSITLEAQAKAILDKVALDLEARMDKIASFDLVRVDNKGTLYSEIIREHIALENHPVAEAADKKNQKLSIPSNRDNKERLTIDKSKEVPEFEPVHKFTAGQDADTIRDELNPILNNPNLTEDEKAEDFNNWLDGKIKLRDIPEMKVLIDRIITASSISKQQMDNTLDIIEKVAIQQSSISKNEFTHIPLIQQAKDTLQANNELMQTFMPVLKEYIASRQEAAKSVPAEASKSLLKRLMKRIW